MKKYCYRYDDGNDQTGRPIIKLDKRVIIRETEKTFWHVGEWDWLGYPYVGPKKNVKRCLKGAARSRFHYTKEEALLAFVYRKIYQIRHMQLTRETVQLCLAGLHEAGIISKSKRNTYKVERLPERDIFLAADEPGPIASEYTWE